MGSLEALRQKPTLWPAVYPLAQAPSVRERWVEPPSLAGGYRRDVALLAAPFAALSTRAQSYPLREERKAGVFTGLANAQGRPTQEPNT